jgi:uncharacterized protein YwlG (UPF0340 family)
MGRPGKERRISLKINDKVYQEFRTYCKAHGTNVSVYVRQHIQDVLFREKEKARQSRVEELTIAEREKGLGKGITEDM